MAKIPVPSALDLSDPEQASENWTVFKNQWQNYEILLAAGRVRGQDFTGNQVRVALFITLIGNEGIKLLNKLGGTDGKEIGEIFPCKNLNASPAQLFFSRTTKTLLPTSEIALKPKLQDNVPQRWFHKKETYRKHYDKTAKDLKSLVPGQEVWIQLKPDDKKATWSKGKIVRREGERRYLVEVDGRLYRRNRKFLRP